MKIIELQDYKSFDDLYNNYLQSKNSNNLRSLLMLFVASDDPSTKQSWCPDCRNAKPVIDSTITDFKFNDQLVLAVVNVGQRDEWKTDENPYRKHPLKVTAVPTLLSLAMNKRLVESDCLDQAKVSHMFSNSL